MVFVEIAPMNLCAECFKHLNAIDLQEYHRSPHEAPNAELAMGVIAMVCMVAGSINSLFWQSIERSVPTTSPHTAAASKGELLGIELLMIQPEVAFWNILKCLLSERPFSY